jgi:hypothetical protein
MSDLAEKNKREKNKLFVILSVFSIKAHKKGRVRKPSLIFNSFLQRHGFCRYRAPYVETGAAVSHRVTPALTA